MNLVNTELSILDFLQEHLKCSFLDKIVPVITALGDKGIIWIALALFFIITGKQRKIGFMIAAVLIIGFIDGNLLLKNIIARERPFTYIEFPELLIAQPKDYSFPSGHTMSSFGVAFVILYGNKKLGAAALIIAALIAFSRLYLYVHFPTDVIGGILLGCFNTILAVCIVNKAEKTLMLRRT